MSQVYNPHHKKADALGYVTEGGVKKMKMNLTRNKKLAIGSAIALGIALGLFAMVYLIASWFENNTIVFQSPILVDVTTQKAIYTKSREPKIKRIFVREPTCEWSRECVEQYIDFVAKGDEQYSKWAKFTALHEGGYASQFAQQNWNDSHSNGKKGSFGQFQFGEGTYFDYCEDNSNWQMDWKAQTRCSKIIWDKGQGLAHSTWYNTTNKYLQSLGLASL